uniref:Putative Diaminohydroxyphosphoribosylaminopyrimidine deaminase n=1 Tax=mine drainage metagenome TaxID=410659 RepID=E6PGZ9_9ZZZZ
MSDGSDTQYMIQAVDEARRSVDEDDGRGHPRVGAVVVKDGKILAKTCRGDMEAGEHAEFTALEKMLSRRVLSGCTVYTTLEPCTTRNHPKIPCADRLVERRVSRVVIGMLDPNQTITGKGILRLRRAGIAVDLFPTELMSQLEELNRDFVRQMQAERDAAIVPGIEEAGLSAFYPSRDYYGRYRPTAGTIDRYVGTAQNSAILVSVNLMTGLPFHDLWNLLEAKLVRSTEFVAVISLLDPRRAELMSTIGTILAQRPDHLAGEIRATLRGLQDCKGRLTPDASRRFQLRVHSVLPFGSAILLDHRTESGRIQIETKPYKAGLQKSFGFEIIDRKESVLYRTLAKSYEDLLKDGVSVNDISLDD